MCSIEHERDGSYCEQMPTLSHQDDHDASLTWPGQTHETVARDGQMDESAVKRAYRRWAPIYDMSFGRIASWGRQQAVEEINKGSGRVLEVGVGTGLSLPSYKRGLDVVGIDLSPEMLDKARDRVAEHGLDNVSGLHEMDAGELRFADHSFDTVVAMYVITVVPNPEKVMRELERVTKPGGTVLLVNHFSTEDGARGFVERQMAPFAAKLGWRPVFPIDRVMGAGGLSLVSSKALKPAGLFTMLRFEKQVAETGKRVA